MARCRKIRKGGAKMRGCWRACKSPGGARLDRRSLRWRKSGKAWVLVGCPRGRWQPRKQRCAVGTRAAEVLTPTTGCAR